MLFILLGWMGCDRVPGQGCNGVFSAVPPGLAGREGFGIQGLTPPGYALWPLMGPLFGRGGWVVIGFGGGEVLATKLTLDEHG